jgi:hypothetical protein
MYIGKTGNYAVTRLKEQCRHDLLYHLEKFVIAELSIKLGDHIVLSYTSILGK